MNLLAKLKHETDWSLFLDRDGVINERLMDDYVKTPEGFHFLAGVPEAIAGLSQYFTHLFIVTNQQGIGKGLMTNQGLERIHAKMLDTIAEAGGRITKIYYCPDLKDAQSPNRKPNPGMALQAKKEYPEIALNKSVMVGDTLSDMQFGKKVGMINIFVGQNEELEKISPDLIDAVFPSLHSFYQAFLTA